jgi:hypothetical protein
MSEKAKRSPGECILLVLLCMIPANIMVWLMLWDLMTKGCE